MILPDSLEIVSNAVLEISLNHFCGPSSFKFQLPTIYTSGQCMYLYIYTYCVSCLYDLLKTSIVLRLGVSPPRQPGWFRLQTNYDPWEAVPKHLGVNDMCFAQQTSVLWIPR